MSALATAERGFTLVELILAMAVAAVLMATMSGIVNTAFEIRRESEVRNDATREGRFAMQRMVAAVSGAGRILLPLNDNPGTNWSEDVRVETVPPSPPQGDSTLATAVLAVTLDPSLDLDRDGFADADNDKDGRVDEDPGDDVTNDAKPGVMDFDDDGDGSIDETTGAATFVDDDEDGTDSEDRLDGADDDADGSPDEDPPADMDGDGAPGIAGFDDDGDGNVDEGNVDDDDEDGAVDEDWLDAVVFFLDNDTLMERRPDLDAADGTVFTDHAIADNVTLFRVERIAATGRRAILVDITLELTYPGADPLQFNTRVRVGSRP